MRRRNQQPERVRVRITEVQDVTAAAVLVSVERREGEEDVWLPRSQVHEVVRHEEADRRWVAVTPWIAKKKDLMVLSF